MLFDANVRHFLVAHFLSAVLFLIQTRPLRVVHSALCTRVLLNLRNAAIRTPTITLGDPAQTSLAFGYPHDQEGLGSDMSGSEDENDQDMGFYLRLDSTMYEA